MTQNAESNSAATSDRIFVALAIYAVTGGIVSFPLLLSYLYAAVAVLWVGLSEGAIFEALAGAATLIGVSMFYSGLRFLFWLPSLLIWIFVGDTSFWEWLALGFYIESR